MTQEEIDVLLDQTFDRLKHAVNAFDIAKAEAIARYVQWRIEREDRNEYL